jgi:hypothetical protein
VSVQTLDRYIGVVAEAEAAFWFAVYRKWPELRGKLLSADGKEVKILDEELPCRIP